MLGPCSSLGLRLPPELALALMILMALRNLDIGDPLIRATVKVAHCLVGPPATCLSHRVAGVEAERGAEGVGNEDMFKRYISELQNEYILGI